MKKRIFVLLLVLIPGIWIFTFQACAQQMPETLTNVQKSRNANVLVYTRTNEQPFYHGQKQTGTFAVRRRKLLTEGVKALQAKEYQKAIQFLTPLVDHYHELDDYVRYFLAKAYAGEERKNDALILLQEVLNRFPQHPLEENIRLTMADILFEIKQYHSALAIYKSLRASTKISQGTVYYKLGQIFMNIDDSKEAVSAFHHFISLYPKHPEVKSAKAALKNILATHPELKPVWTEETLFEHTNALFNARMYTSAIAQYQAFLQQYPQSAHTGESEFGIAKAYLRLRKKKKGMNALEQMVTHYRTTQPELAAQALYTIGTKHWNADHNQDAKQTMQRLVKDFGETSWGDNAYYVLGRIFQSKRAYQDASHWYMALYAHYPESQFAEEALWRAGWSYYLDKHYTQAIQMFSQVITAFPARDYSDDSYYWKSRSFEKQKKQQLAIATYRQLIKIIHESYYAIKAQARLQELKVPGHIEHRQAGEPPEFSAVMTKLQQEFHPTLYQDIALHIEKARELHEAQLQHYAQKEVAWLETFLKEQATVKDAPEKHMFALYFLSRLYAQAGKYLKAIRLVGEIEALLQKTQTQSFSYALEQLKYPLAYHDLIRTYAQKNGIDPFLVASIIRQESAYDPQALSSAKARGLMQVIPSTGKLVAKQLGLKKYTTARLYDPETNIAIGTAYLAGLLKRFNGNLYRSIAAYNAGPGATQKWWPRAGNPTGDIEQQEIVENITYRATRNYVKRVLRNQYHYRRIYPTTFLSFPDN